jgi:uncharacterized protein
VTATIGTELPPDIPALLDWKRQVFSLYARVRETGEPRRAWSEWKSGRDSLFRAHSQSPIPGDQQQSFQALPYFDYNPRARVLGVLENAAPEHFEINTSGETTMGFTRFARVTFDIGGGPASLDAYWLEGYGGGVFLPFRDATSGKTTYGAGRYLLDTVKGADLGMDGDKMVLDFNFAYNPSCAYDPRWVCPLAPPANRLNLAVEAGEKHSD